MSGQVDQRIDKFPIAKIAGTSLSISASLTADSTQTYGLYGILKSLRGKCPSLTTDTTYTFSLIDSDSCVCYTSGAIAHNTTVYYFLAVDDYVPLAGEYTGRWTFPVTAQTLAVDALEAILHLDDER